MSELDEVEDLLREAQTRAEEEDATWNSFAREMSNQSSEWGRTLMRQWDELHDGVPRLLDARRRTKDLEDRLRQGLGHVDSAVRTIQKLHRAQNRARQAMERVEDILELQNCTTDIRTALASEDAEAAAMALRRFRGVQKTLQVPEDESDEMQKAEDTTAELLEAQLDRAVGEGDADGVARSCQLLTVLGQGMRGRDRFFRFLRIRSHQALLESLDSVLTSVHDDLDEEMAQEDSSNGNTAGRSESRPPAAARRALDRVTSSIRSKGSPASLSVNAVSSVFAATVQLLQESAPLVAESFGSAQDGEELWEILHSTADRYAGPILAAALQSPWIAATTPRGGGDADSGQRLHLLVVLLQRSQTYMRALRTVPRRVQESLPRFTVDPVLRRHRAITEASAELAGLYTRTEMEQLERSFTRARELEEVAESLPCQSSWVEDVGFVLSRGVDRALATGHADAVCGVLNCVTGLVVDHLLPELRARFESSVGHRSLDLPPGLVPLKPHADGENPHVRRLGEALLQSPFRAAIADLEAGAHPARDGGGGGHHPSSSTSSSAAAGSVPLAANGQRADGDGNTAASPRPGTPRDLGGDEADGIALRERRRTLREGLCRLGSETGSASLVLNSLVQTEDMVRTLTERVDRQLETLFVDKNSYAKVDSCLHSLREAGRTAERVVEAALKRLCASLTPQLRTVLSLLSGAAAPIVYALSEHDAAQLADRDTFRVEFIGKLEHLLGPFELLLLPSLAEAFAARIATYFARQLQHIVMRKSFTIFGAVQFDRDVRRLAVFFGRLAGGEGRAKFSRLISIARLLCTASREEAWDEFDRIELVDEQSGDAEATVAAGWSSAGVSLTRDEVRRILTLRTDWLDEEEEGEEAGEFKAESGV